MSRVRRRIQAQNQVHRSLIRHKQDFAVDHFDDEGSLKASVRARVMAAPATKKTLATG